jgi:hypothetical protein
MQDEKHLSSGKAPSPHCDLRSFLRPRYISSVREVHLREEQILKIPHERHGGRRRTYAADASRSSRHYDVQSPFERQRGSAAEPIEATYDTSSKKLSCKGSYSVLTGPVTAAHFHGPAEKGKNAGVVAPVDAAKSPFEGSATLTDAQAGDLTKGDWYFNVHTAENKGGEIRGQMTKGP